MMGTMEGWITRRRKERELHQRIALLAADNERERVRKMLESMAADPVAFFTTPRNLSRREAQSHALRQAAERL